MITPMPQDNTTTHTTTHTRCGTTHNPITDSITLSHSTTLHHIMLFHGYDSDDDPLPYRDRESDEESDCDDEDEESNTADEDDDIASLGDHSDNEVAVDDKEEEEEEENNKSEAEVEAEVNGEDVEENDVVVDMNWKTKRLELISMLLDDAHDIHLLMGRTKKERCEKIWRKYASEFDKIMVVNSVSRSLLQLKKGELRDLSKPKTKDGKPFWSSSKEKSKAYDLLYKIRFFPSTSMLSTEEIYERHEVFREHAYEDFKEYDKRMIELAQKHSKKVEEEVREWELQRAATVKRMRTNRGKLFWSAHAAKQQLIEDTKSGKTVEMKPAELYKSQSCYQEFSLTDFRKHVYQEKYKQLAGPYWQKKRNQIAQREHLEEVDRMYSEFLHSNYEENLHAITVGLQNF